MKFKIASIMIACSLWMGCYDCLFPNQSNYTVLASETESIYEAVKYQVCGDHIEITGCVPGTGGIVIPAVIDGLPVTTIQENAFEGRIALNSLMIPESITEIQADAFAGCDALDIIYYKGSASQWDDICIEEGNQRLRFADIYCDYNSQRVERENRFIPGVDNWCFANSSENFGDGDYVMTEEHSLLASERIRLYAGTVWEGSCYGMAVTTVLACAGILNPADLQAGAASLYEIDVPPTLDVLSTINYYFNTQLADPQRLQDEQISDKAAEKIQRLLGYLEDDSPVLLSVNGYFGEEHGYQNHSVVAYDVEYGTYEWDGVTYDGKVLIYDNNYPDLPDEACLYFDSNHLGTYILPVCGIISGKQGGIMSVTESLDILNYHGLFCGNLHEMSASNLLIVNGKFTDAAYSLWQDSEPEGAVRIDHTPIAYVDTKNTTWLALQSEYGYTIRTEAEELLDMTVPYQDAAMRFYATNATSASFAPNGYLALQGVETKYAVSIHSSNNGIAVKGNAADDMYLRATNNGYLLGADSLAETSVKLTCGEVSLIGEFSTDYSEVLIYQGTDETLVVSADTDGDGSYETEIPIQTEYPIGDINSDGSIDAKDAATILTTSAAVGAGSDSGLGFLLEAAADVDSSGSFDATDAALLLEYAVYAGAGGELSFEEYLKSDLHP